MSASKTLASALAIKTEADEVKGSNMLRKASYEKHSKSTRNHCETTLLLELLDAPKHHTQLPPQAATSGVEAVMPMHPNPLPNTLSYPCT